MERLKEDIDNKAEKFEHIDYYDAMLRDGNAKDIAIAGNEANQLDDRRKPLVTVNPLFAKVSEIPPVPSVEDVVYDYVAINLPGLARTSLNELENELSGESPAPTMAEDSSSQVMNNEEFEATIQDLATDETTADSVHDTPSIVDGEMEIELDVEEEAKEGEVPESLDQAVTGEIDDAGLDIENEEQLDMEDNDEEDEGEDDGEEKENEGSK